MRTPQPNSLSPQWRRRSSFMALAAVSQALEISESTLERWSKQYGGMKSEEAVRLKKLEEEHQRLKQLVVDQALNIQILK